MCVCVCVRGESKVLQYYVSATFIYYFTRSIMEVNKEIESDSMKKSRKKKSNPNLMNLL